MTYNHFRLLRAIGFPDSSIAEESTYRTTVQEIPPVQFLVRNFCWRKDRLPTPVFLSFLCGSAGKESSCSEGDLSSIPGLGRSSAEAKGYPPVFWPGQFHGLYSCPLDCKESDTTE